ncbi:hypothetical protein [Aeropyrum camini]|uniref:hypothetical protein n=1 Tax=Aeropyrum camini TaxID=229980 RepID=UPI0012E3179C|nr:hypothetical protein [Aeropyrum camini]
MPAVSTSGGGVLGVMGGRRFGAWFNASWPLILALIIMLSIIAPAAHAQKASPSIRHPPDLKDPISSLLDAGLIPTLTYEEYVVLSWQLSRVLSNLLAETLASQGSTIGNEDLGVAVAMLAASETLSRLPENYSPEAESVLDKAKMSWRASRSSCSPTASTRTSPTRQQLLQ